MTTKTTTRTLLEDVVVELRASVATLGARLDAIEARLDAMGRAIVTGHLVVQATAGGPAVVVRAGEDFASLSCQVSDTDNAPSVQVCASDEWVDGLATVIVSRGGLRAELEAATEPVSDGLSRRLDALEAAVAGMNNVPPSA